MDDGVDAGAGAGPPAVLGDDELPAAGVERGDRIVHGDLHLTGRGSGGAGGRVDRAVADQEQAPPGATPAAIRCTISSTDPATWT